MNSMYSASSYIVHQAYPSVRVSLSINSSSVPFSRPAVLSASNHSFFLQASTLLYQANTFLDIAHLLSHLAGFNLPLLPLATMHQNALASILLGAGVGLVAAHPAPWWRKEPKHHTGGYTGRFSPSAVPSASVAATGGFSSYSVPSGSGVAAPTRRGYSYSTGTAAYSYSGTSVTATSTSVASVASTSAVVSASSSNDTAVRLFER